MTEPASDSRPRDGAAEALSRAVNARSVAVVGVSEDPLKYGSRLARSVIDCEYGGELHLVNPRGGNFLGHELVPSLSEIGKPLDLVVVSVPSRSCPAVVAEAAGLGCGCAVVVATGFSEIGAVELERELGQAATGSQLRLIGPNCMGFFSAGASLNAMGDSTVPRGRIAVVAQSGIVGISVFHRAKEHRLGLSHFFSIGNQLDLGFEEICAFLATDDGTDAVLLYVEQIRDLPRFLTVAGRLRERVPVAVLRGGKTPAGTRAAASHTAAVADDDAVLAAALRRSGLIEAASDSELMLAALAFSEPGQMRGRSVSVVSDSGGFATLGADLAVRAGLSVQPHPESLQCELREVLLPQATVQNPVDMIGGPELRPDIFERTLGACLAAPEIDAVILAGAYGGYGDVGGEALTARENAAAAKIVARRDHSGKSLVVQTLYADDHSHGGIEELRRHGVPVVKDLEDGMLILALKAWQGERIRPTRHWGADPEPGRMPVWLTEDASREWLAARLAAPLPEHRVAISADAAVAAARAIGFPVVMKVILPGVVHKSDVGGVLLSLDGEQAVRDAFARLAAVAAHAGEPCRVLLVRQAPAEVGAFVGVRRHRTLGPLVTVGSGGLFVHELADHAILFPPLTAADLSGALADLRLGHALRSPRADPRLLAEFERLVLAVGELAASAVELAELDLNPVLLGGARAHIVDVRVAVVHAE